MTHFVPWMKFFFTFNATYDLTNPKAWVAWSKSWHVTE